MSVKDLVLKTVKRSVKKREFRFTVVVYPVFLCGYTVIKNSKWLHDVVSQIGLWYFAVSYLVALYIVFMVAYEVVEKRLKHKVQGDKLKQKQERWKW